MRQHGTLTWEARMKILIGTAQAYVAPEYANSGLLNEKSDIYSFGVLLLEAVTRRDSVDYGRPANEVTQVRLLGAVSRTGFGRGTGTSRVRLGNVPDSCKVNQGRHGLRGTGLVRDGRRLRDVSVDFCVKKKLFIKY
ncbi:probable receptor-like protein kinase At2g42960 [Raphanus sativus]|uniref:non-specific serine/threonine protein kinase n=1 Tax=Raphanus sativus TaxID=3726 RepID=A0A9W3CS60_RAPSA|nr:probable receptor-like protein kinase At2g42960 [Raphanus sativus]XP_056854464.1 probable receptor-like protein kinase At2g42960 [Raphanus sativus]